MTFSRSSACRERTIECHFINKSQVLPIIVFEASLNRYEAFHVKTRSM